MPALSLCTLPDDPLLDGIFRYLEPRQLIRLRLTCSRLYALTHLRSVWHDALEKLRRDEGLPLPRPSRPLLTLSAHELEAAVVKMVRLDKGLTRPRVKPTLIRTFNIQGEQAPRISCMQLLTGGDWLLTANAEEVMCWDLESPDPCSAAVYRLAPVSVSGKEQGYKDICVRNLQVQLQGYGDEAIVAAYMSYDGHQSNVWNDKVAVWRVTGLLRTTPFNSSFITLLCFPDYAPEYGMSDLDDDCVAFLGREHETPVISITKWRTGDDSGEYAQAKFRPDFTPVIPDSEPLRVQGIKLVPPHVLVVAGPVLALFQIPPFERVKHLCGDAPRLSARQIYRFDPRAHLLMGDFVGLSQGPAMASSPSVPQPITVMTARARVMLMPAKEGANVAYVLPPIVTRLRVWTHRAAKPVVVGPSGTRGVWVQRPSGIKPRLIAWTAARDKELLSDGSTESGEDSSARSSEDSETADEQPDEAMVAAALAATPGPGPWPRSGESIDDVTQGWNALPRGRARKVELYPIRAEDVKRVAFDEGTGRTCLGMRNGEVHVLDFA